MSSVRYGEADGFSFAHDVVGVVVGVFSFGRSVSPPAAAAAADGDVVVLMMEVGWEYIVYDWLGEA